MKNSKIWSTPGWPWELELLAFVFVLSAIVVPFYLQYTITPDPDLETDKTYETHWEKEMVLVWAVVVVGVYLAHLAIAGSSLDFMSTSFSHLFSPLLFAMITYFRIYHYTRDGPGQFKYITGSLAEVAVLAGAVILVTLILARLRMASYLRRFRDISWSIVSPTVFDSTFFLELAGSFRPLIYPPRRYMACEEGILIEGWFYIMPIPYTAMRSMNPISKAQFMLSGYSLATSTRSLLRVILMETPEPIFISPADRDTFAEYCQQQMPRRGTPHGGTQKGTRHGTGTA